jgi:4-hydroxybenzoyl-CoA thioesterase
VTATNRRAVRVEWGDCNPAAVVHVARYFEWFDASTAALFEAVGFRKVELVAARGIVGFPVVDIRAQFRVSATYRDELTIESSIVRWGVSSFDVRHRVHRADRLLVEATETRVWSVRDTAGRIRSAPIAGDVKERFLSR